MFEGSVVFWFRVTEARGVDIAGCCSALRGGRWLTQQQLSKAVKSADVIDQQQQQQELFEPRRNMFGSRRGSDS